MDCHLLLRTATNLLSNFRHEYKILVICGARFSVRGKTGLRGYVKLLAGRKIENIKGEGEEGGTRTARESPLSLWSCMAGTS